MEWVQRTELVTVEQSTKSTTSTESTASIFLLTLEPLILDLVENSYVKKMPARMVVEQT